MRSPLLDIAVSFARLGLVAFGGPAAHIALMEDEFVSRRKWVSRERFLDLMGATNLIPGPNSTEMTMHLGYERAGRLGLVVAGACFIAPAALLTGLVAWLYVTYGQVPQAEPFLAGLKPAVVAVILGAVWKLGKKALKNAKLIALAVAVGAAVFAGVNEIAALFAGGLLGMALLRISASVAVGVLLLTSGKTVHAATAASAISLTKLGLTFLKIGAVLYGSGYVLIAFLEGELVENLGWLTQQQLLDAIALGQFTPGPVLTTATFIGYLLAGVPGALVATAGIFLPSFFFVLALNPLIARLRESEWTSAFLDAINASALALMAAVAIKLARTSLADPLTITIFVAAAGVVLFTRVNSAWVIVGGALIHAAVALV